MKSYIKPVSLQTQFLFYFKELFLKCYWLTRHQQGRHLRGAGGPSPPPPPPPRKKKKKKKRKRKRKKRKKEKKKKEGKKGTMNNAKLLHIKCCFFQFFNSLVAMKNKNKFGPPKKKLKWRPWVKVCWTCSKLHLRQLTHLGLLVLNDSSFKILKGLYDMFYVSIICQLKCLG